MNIGTIGHVDHGKTTLTEAITKCLEGIGTTKYKQYSDIDNCAEERNRGITINAAHIEYETVKRHYSHIDCPGHQQYVKNMLTGAVQMDGAILVVAVNDGPQVQTREHVILAKEIGIPYMLVYINKIDLAKGDGMKELVELEVVELLEQYGFPSPPITMGSARAALEDVTPTDIGMGSVKQLLSHVDEYIKQPASLVEPPFILSVEGTIVVRGRGTVVTGKVERGAVNINDELEVINDQVRKTACMGLEMFRRTLDQAVCGDNVGVLLKNIKQNEVGRGDLLATPNAVKPASKFKCKVYIIPHKEGGRKTGFAMNYKPQFFFRTHNATGTLRFPEGVTIVMPGDSVELEVSFVKPAPITTGLRVIMREGNLTIGAGVVTTVL